MFDNTITFALTKKRLHEWNDDYLKRTVSTIIANAQDVNSDDLSVKRQSEAIVSLVNELGLAWTACFANLEWLVKLRSKLTPVNSLFTIARGERRGWDNMFYPQNEEASSIEKEFLAPVVKTAATVQSMIATADGLAFCCDKSINELQQNNCTGALAWIERFSKEVNGTGKPLPKVLARHGVQWYEMSSSTKADIAVSMNPGERLFFMRMKEPTFVNQRLIRLSKNAPSVDVELCHALLSSLVGCFFQEAYGFGRGEGALDLNATKLKNNLQMLNPNILSNNTVLTIKNAFSKIAARPVKQFEEECKSADRLAFERTVLKAYECEELLEPILHSTLLLYKLRQASTHEKSVE